MTSSSSPNYPIIASLEIAVEFMHRNGKERIDELLEFASILRGEISQLDKLFCVVPPDDIPYDPLRVTINTSNLNMSGISAKRWLANQYGIIAERGSFRHVMFIIHFGVTRDHIGKLIAALRKLDQQVACERLVWSALPHTPRAVLTPREAF